MTLFPEQITDQILPTLPASWRSRRDAIPRVRPEELVARDRKTGLMIAAMDAEALAGPLAHRLTSPATVKRIGAAAQAYGSDRVAGQFEATCRLRRYRQ